MTNGPTFKRTVNLPTQGGQVDRTATVVRGPTGPPGKDFDVLGVLSGTDTPLPPHPELGDVWMLGSPVPDAAPAFGDPPVPSAPAADTSTALVSSLNPSTVGASVTFTATVTSDGSPVTSGTVTFRDGSTVLSANVAVNGSGVATYSTTSLSQASHSITATYNGTVDFASSSSNTVTQTVNSSGGGGSGTSTTTTLSSSLPTAVAGHVVIFTANVVAAGGATVIGKVTFKDGTTTLVTDVPVDGSGNATLTTSALSVGIHNMTALFQGTASLNPSTSNTVSQEIDAGSGTTPTTTTLAVEPYSTFEVNEWISLTAVVRASGNVPAYPGSVTFMDGATQIGEVLITGAGFATLSTNALTLGSHSINAVYNAADPYMTSSASPLSVTVTAASTPPASWQAAVDSHDLHSITSWYRANTGHLAQGWDPAGLWNPAGVGSLANVEITAAWLTANAAAGKVVNDGGGHWTVTGLHTSYLRISVSNLTLNHCWIFRPNYGTNPGSGIDVFDASLGAVDNAMNSNLVINYTTFSTDFSGVEGGFGDAFYFNPGYAAPDGLVLNNCDVYGWPAANKVNKSTTVNYSYAHDLGLFGVDPHNTSGSIRGQYCTFNRNLFTDGTSSDISLYADSYPYTNFFVTDNVLWVNPVHASQEINFPTRPPNNWHVLEAGFTRVLTGNRMRNGSSGDNAYFTEIAGNSLITGEPLFGDADLVANRATGQPSILAGFSSGFPGYAMLMDSIQSWNYTPSPSSTLFLFYFCQNAGHNTTASPTVTDSSGATWTLVQQSAMENAPANLDNYAVSCTLWKMETGSGAQAWRRVTVDPFPGSQIGAQSLFVIEVTGRTGMSLAKPLVQSAVGHSLGFGATTRTGTTGSLSSAATSGHLVLALFGFQHEPPNATADPTTPAGWTRLANFREAKAGMAVFWRNNFTGTNMAISDLGADCAQVLTMLLEFS